MPEEARSTYENLDVHDLPYDESGGVRLSRGKVRRKFVGDLVGESRAELLIAAGAPDRLGYVAVDRFTGSIGGRTGSFVFQHGGTIDRGVLTPFGYVVPGTATGDLAGLTGSVLIQFVPPATHTITLAYEFEPRPRA
jgi:hypothetical protein